MAKIKLPLGKSWVQGRSYAANNMDILNWYPEIPTGGNRSDTVLLPTPGSIKIKDLGVAGAEPRIFGAYVDYSKTPDSIFVVAGNFSSSPVLYELIFTDAETCTVNNRGTLTDFTGENEVMMESDGTYIMVFETVTGTAYTWNKSTSTLAKITDLDYPPNQTPAIPCDTLAYLDGYWIVSERQGGKFFISNLSDPTAWTATDFATAEQSSDPILRAFSIRNELWLFGKNTTEVWQNVGNPDFPFEPVPNAVFDVGVSAPLSVKNIGGALMFISMDKSGHSKILQANGFQLEPVSTQEIEYKLNNELNTVLGLNNIYEYGQNVVAEVYTQGGHSFYMITVPGGIQNREERYPSPYGSQEGTSTSPGSISLLFAETGTTLCYDLSSKLWHQRKSLDKTLFTGSPSSEFPNPYFFRFFVHANNSIYGMGGGDSTVSDTEDGVYRIRLSHYVDLYESTGPVYIPQVRGFISPYYSNNRDRVFWHSLELEVEQFSPEFDSNIDEDFYFDLYYSDNDGTTWKYAGRKTPQKESATPSGIQLTRLKWNRLGYSRNRLYAFRARTNIRCVVLGLYAEISSEGNDNATL